MGAKCLQCPHHGAKYSTSHVPSATFSLKFSVVRDTTSLPTEENTNRESAKAHTRRRFFIVEHSLLDKRGHVKQATTRNKERLLPKNGRLNNLSALIFQSKESYNSSKPTLLPPPEGRHEGKTGWEHKYKSIYLYNFTLLAYFLMEEMIESSVGTFGESVTIRRMSAVILCE